MGDIEYLISIVAKLRDEASPGIAALKAEINKLKGTQDAENAQSDLADAIKDTGDEADRSKKKHEALRSEQEKSRRASDDAGRGSRSLGEDVERTARSHDKAADSVGGHTQAQKDFADALSKVKKEQEDAASGAEDLRKRTSELHSAWNDFESDLNRGSFSKGEATRGLKEFSAEFSNLSRKLETGGQDWKDTEATLDRIAGKLKNPDLASTGGLARSALRTLTGEGEGGRKSAAGEVLESIDSKVGDLGVRITGVSSALRGFFDLAKIGLSQQLITGVLSLAGGLVSVASAAAQAGAALAGAFISGLGQAIPMLAVVAAAVERFKNILQAVSVAGQAEQQKFSDPTEKQTLQLQQASQLISSQQQLSNSYIQLYEAQQRVRDSQIALTEARYTAQRQITELANAEKNARLEAEGANLSLAESKRQLQIAIQKGDTAGLQQAELAVKEAELNKRTAEYAVPKAEREARLARERGVSGAPSVISAREGLEGAKVAQLQAAQAGEAAKRQQQITELQQAARSSKETTYESQEKFLKRGMSSTEIGLTDALIGIEKELKSPDSPLKKITDYFVEPFTNAVEKIRSLLHNADFLGPIDELAKAMGSGLGKLEHAAYGGEGTDFFVTMARDATENIPVVTQAIERIMKLFEDIAKAADPAFHKLSEDWNRFWGTLDRKYEGNGLEKLTNFFNKSAEYAESFGKLGAALVGLFISIGHDAAPQGEKTVTSLTESIKEATGWVQSHGPEVTKFFNEARRGLSVIGSTLFEIGKELLQVFSLDSLTAFSGFLKNIIIPGLRNIVLVIGSVISTVMEFFNLFGGPGRRVLELIGTSGLIVVGLAKIWGLIKTLKEIWITFTALMEETSFLDPVTLALTALGVLFLSVFGSGSEGQKKVKISTEEATQAYERQAEALRVIKGLNDEYKSAELSVKEARTQVISSEQGLSKARREPLQPGETDSERKIRLESDEQQERRSKINLEERERAFRQIPKEQKEKISTSNNESDKSVEAARSQYQQALENLNEQKKINKSVLNAESGLSKNETEEIRNAGLKLQIPFEEKLAKAKQVLTEKTKENAETVKSSNNVISQSNIETAKGASRISDAYAEAFKKFENSVHKGAESASEGMGKIRKLVDESLKKYGVTPAEISGASHAAGRVAGAVGNIGRSVSSGLPALASGAFVEPRSGGVRANIAEAGYGEAVVSTDPRHAQRSRAILGQYFSRAPHMAAGGFVADPGTNFTVNQEPKIVTELRKLGEYLGTTIYGISGYRSPAHSVEVGGFSNDPHTRGEAADIGIGSNSRESAARLTAALLAKFDLYRPFYPASAAEINHVQLLPGDVPKIAGSSPGAIGKIVEQVGSTAQDIHNVVAPRIKGGGEIGKVAQKALDLSTKAANIYLEKYASPVASMSSRGSALARDSASAGKLGPSNKLEFARYLSQFSKLPYNFLLAWINHEQGSSTVEGGNNWLNIETGGPGGGSGPYGATAKWVERHTPKVAAAIEYEWLQSNLPQLLRAKNAEEAVTILENSGYAESHYNHESPQSFLSAYAMGGMVGDSVRRLAVRHIRKKMLKFASGGRAPWGGEPVPIIAHAGERIMNPAQYHETARLAGTTPGGLDSHLGYDSSPRQHFADGGLVVKNPRGTAQPITSGSPVEVPTEYEIGTLNSILKVFKNIKEGFKKLGKATKKDYNEQLTKYINEIIIESSGVLAKLQEGREFFKSKLERKAVEGEYKKSEGKIKLGSKGEVGIAEATSKNLAEESRYLQQERKLIDQSIAETKKLKNSSAKTTALHALMIKQKELGEVIDQNIEARYQAETQALQDRITEVNNSFQVISQEQTTAVSSAQGLGNLSEVGGLEQQIRKASESQLSTLTPLLKEAENLGNRELASTIKQEMVSLRQTITNSIVESFGNAQTMIQRESQRAETSAGEKLGLGKVFAQEGNFARAGEYEKLGLEEKGSNLQSSYNQRKSLYFEASEKGDTAAMITLYEELQKNTVEISENNLALKENAVVTRELVLNQIQATGQFKSSIFSTAMQGLELIGKTTGYTNVGGLLSAAKGQSGALGTERSELEKQAAGIGLGVEGMTPSQILSYLASPEGQVKLSQLEKGEDKGEKEQMYKLVDALETNATNTLKNAEEIAKLNGQLNQPQSWSTTAWQQFRGAFFGGMGNLLPQYSSILPSGAIPTEMPKYGEMAPGASRAAPTIGSLSLTHPVEKLDPALLGEELSHHIATTPTMQ